MYRQNINALLNAWNTGNLDGLDQHVMRDTLRHAPASLNSNAGGLEELKAVITNFRTAFPDLRLSLDEEIYFEGRSAIRWTFSGTNTGPGDFEPTGKTVRISGASITHYEDGKIKEEFVYFDTVDFFTQLGLKDLSHAAAG